jgi:SAM-dependent methyltransferase
VALMSFMERILEHPTIYALLQAPFVEEKFAVIERHLRRQDVRRVLDVGCGPGINATRFPGAEYVGVDINERYLAVARAKHQGRFIQADLESADLSSLGTFDTILVNSLLHHVPDEAVRRILRQLRDLLEPDGTVHMLELMWPERGSLVGIMALVDRGRYARRVAAWRDLFEEHFETLSLEPHTFKAGLWGQLYFRGKRKPGVLQSDASVRL